MLKRTPIFDFHQKRGSMAEFAGFEMPLFYEGIIPETIATRNAAGIFDVSHMGRVRIYGKDSTKYLDHLLTADMGRLENYQAKYCLMCNNAGNIIDDLVTIRIENQEFIIIWNASNREKNLGWVLEKSVGYDIKVDDFSDRSFMYALQGPKAANLLQKICDIDLSQMKRFRSGRAKVAETECLLSRTGYTGEDGFEIISEEILDAGRVWSALIDLGAAPAGLGARDVLRLEAGMMLYGNDINDSVNPFEARLDFAVNMEKQEFIGRESLLRVQAVGLEKYLAGIRMTGKGIPRKDYGIFLRGDKIGEITSGTFSPTAKTGIALGYIDRPLLCGTEVDVRVRENYEKGVITDTPFYDQDTYGWKRKPQSI